MTTTLTDELCTAAEIEAAKAQSVGAFSGFSLAHTKQQLALMLNHVGRDRIFDQYTRHDITHINELLRLCEWVIPDATKAVLTPADWLMIVLSVYFHDFGMVVSTSEFERRSESGFPSFCANELFAGEKGADYKAKVAQLGAEADRFLYQEYVRHTHAERIRHWVLGKAPSSLGLANEVSEALNDLLSKLPSKFRADLALVCESHHRDDLHDLSKYKVSQPYAPDEGATANVHYAALVIRTVDLLHMTSDRTPSILFKLINPSDPISQREWAKQMGVTSVRPRAEANAEGDVDGTVPSFAVEVHAFYEDPSGFFALTAFLAYVRDQLRRTHDWAKLAQRKLPRKYELPWREVDDAHVETAGFVKDKFEFTIDQEKILDLLTGHTLYNDTNVALRELVQNAIDAVRAHEALRVNDGTEYEVVVRWNAAARTLEVQDNGTGMTQEIIERHLLRVGSSRYQDPSFQKQFPEFAPISRFGIGLLSAFMVADAVDIFTCHPDDAEARHVSLKSVHGKYLIRLLDKEDHAEARRLGPHGTLVRLSIRPSARLSDVARIAEAWICVPQYPVFLEEDGERRRLGFASVADALREELRSDGIAVDDASHIQVRQESADDVDVAFAVTWSDAFKEWTFLTARDHSRARLGACVEGIRVEFGTPGFRRQNIYAIANARGRNAPRTNVARSGFESGPSYGRFLRTVYSLLARHISTELRDLHEKRNYSLTWAVREARFIARPLLSDDGGIRDRTLLLDELGRVPLFITEGSDGRHAVTAEALSAQNEFWMLDCELLRSAEKLISEVGANVSLGSINAALGDAAIRLPDGLVLSSLEVPSEVEDELLASREVDRITIHRAQRRVDVRWRKPSGARKWLRFPSERLAHMGASRYRRLARGGELNVNVAIGAIELHGADGETAVQAFGSSYILPGSAISEVAAKWVRLAQDATSDEGVARAAGVVSWLIAAHGWPARLVGDREYLSRYMGQRDTSLEDADAEELVTVASKAKLRLFSPATWLRDSPAMYAF